MVSGTHELNDYNMYDLNVFHITVSQDTHVSFPLWAEYTVLKRLGTKSFCILDALGFCSDCICIMNILKMKPEGTHEIHFHIIHTLYTYTETNFLCNFMNHVHGTKFVYHNLRE